MQLVSNISQVKKNIDTLENYLSDGKGKNYQFAVDIIRRGRKFVVYEVNGTLHFASSRFLGYQNNTRSEHINNEEKDGKETSPRLERIFASKWKPNDELVSLHNSYSWSFNGKPTKHKMSFIFYNVEAEDIFKKATKEPNVSEINTPKSMRHRFVDTERKVEIERIAIETATNHFKNKGYTVSSVEKDNVGWDLDVSKNGQTLKVEVKGLSGSSVVVELTPNEYEKSKKYLDTYRICIVKEALTKPALYIFKSKDKSWFDQDDNELIFQDVIAARCYLS